MATTRPAHNAAPVVIRPPTLREAALYQQTESVPLTAAHQPATFQPPTLRQAGSSRPVTAQREAALPQEEEEDDYDRLPVYKETLSDGEVRIAATR
ncbi:hypothetical protein RI367_000961 [Sorochytrium milnesiophthora]